MLAVICLSAVPDAQGLNYRVQGQVFCKDKPMAGANMTLIGPVYAHSIFNTTDADGTYMFDVPLRSYYEEAMHEVPLVRINSAQSCSTGQLFFLSDQATPALQGPDPLFNSAGSWHWSQENMTERAPTLQVMKMPT